MLKHRHGSFSTDVKGIDTMTQYIQLSRNAHNLAGLRFGRLLVLGAISGGSRVYWHCRCDCGNEVNVRADRLRHNVTKSCGCYNIDATVARLTTHGMTGTRFYFTWRGIVARCTDPNHQAYAQYGGRGIKFYEAWLSDPAAFSEYISQLPDSGRKGYTLDRINNDGNYEPGNLRFASMPEQQRNRQNTHNITHQGKTQCLESWADEYGILSGTLYRRLKLGWPMEKALTQRVRRR